MKALVVAGGMPQITLINQLKERGVETVLVDGSPTPVALPYPDRFYNVNISRMSFTLILFAIFMAPFVSIEAVPLILLYTKGFHTASCRFPCAFYCFPPYALLLSFRRNGAFLTAK